MGKLKINSDQYLHGGKSWAKVVNKVDVSKTSGYAFEGYFLPKAGETEINQSDVIISVGWHGSAKNGNKVAKIFVAKEDSLEEIEEMDYRNIISVRDAVVELLDQQPNPLAKFSKEELIAELERREEKNA